MAVVLGAAACAVGVVSVRMGRRRHGWKPWKDAWVYGMVRVIWSTVGSTVLYCTVASERWFEPGTARFLTWTDVCLGRDLLAALMKVS